MTVEDEINELLDAAIIIARHSISMRRKLRYFSLDCLAHVWPQMSDVERARNQSSITKVWNAELRPKMWAAHGEINAAPCDASISIKERNAAGIKEREWQLFRLMSWLSDDEPVALKFVMEKQ